jgi:hypothetical protein
MGGLNNRMYYLEGVDDWLRPQMREAKKAHVQEE